MSLTIHNVEQGTPEWYEARCGVLTASVVGRMLTPTLRPADNETSRGITLSLAAERITGHVDHNRQTFDMLRGHMDEPVARDAYSVKVLDGPVREVGFMTRDDWGFTLGYSPDGLVGDDGLIEIKSRNQKQQLAHVLAGEVPSMHMAQLQCGLLVAGRDWIDYVAYSNGMHLWTDRVYPDPEWQEAILAAAQKFEESAVDMVARYRSAVANLPSTDRIPDPEELVI